jgi:flagellar hook-length control protein FliK
VHIPVESGTSSEPDVPVALAQEPEPDHDFMPSVFDAVTESVAVARVALGLPTPITPQLQMVFQALPVAPETSAPKAVAPQLAEAIAPKAVAPQLAEAIAPKVEAPIAQPEAPVVAKTPDATPNPEAPAAPETPATPEVRVLHEPRAVGFGRTGVMPTSLPEPISRAQTRVSGPEIAPITPVTAQESDPLVAAEASAEVQAPAAPEQPVAADQPVMDEAVLEKLAAAIPASPQISAAPSAPAMRETEHIHGVAQPLRTALRNAPKDKPNTITLTVRLDPPELGAVRLHVVARGERVHVTMHAESPEAAVALHERREDVVELLRQDGFSLDGFDIDARDGDQQRGDTPEQSRRRTEQFTLEPEPQLAADQTDNELRL